MPDNCRFLAAAIDSAAFSEGVIYRAIKRRVEAGDAAAQVWGAMFTDQAVIASPQRMRAYGFDYLLGQMLCDLKVRGFKEPRLWTFRSRMNAERLLLDACAGVLTVDLHGRSYHPRVSASDWLLLKDGFFLGEEGS